MRGFCIPQLQPRFSCCEQGVLESPQTPDVDKKGRLAERKTELERLYRYIVGFLPTKEPALNPARLDLSVVENTKELKALEDRLDSLICAYVAAHWWYWGQERNWVLGDSTNYIIVPAQAPLAQR